MILAVVFTLAAAMANAINLMTQHKASIWRATTGEGLAAGAGLAAAAAVATSAWPPQSARSCSRRWPCTAARCRWCTAAGYRTGLRAGAAPDMDSPGRGPRRLGVGQRRLRDAGVFMAVGEPTGGHPFPAAKQWRLEQALAAVAEGIGNACGSHGQHREDDGAPGPPPRQLRFLPSFGGCRGGRRAVESTQGHEAGSRPRPPTTPEGTMTSAATRGRQEHRQAAARRRPDPVRLGDAGDHRLLQPDLRHHRDRQLARVRGQRPLRVRQPAHLGGGSR
jgi:hypothetical protein